MAQDNLKQKTKKGLYWSAASNFANQGMRFVFGLILARLLSPDAYGERVRGQVPEPSLLN